MKIAPLRTFALLLSMALALPVAAGQLYKWTDANGRVQYSDTPPPDRKTETFRSGSGTSSSSTAKPAPTAAQQDQDFRKRRSEAADNEEKLAKEEAAKARRDEECKRARNSLTNMEQGGRFSKVNDKGEREFLSDADLQAEKERARRDLDAHCNSDN